MVAATATCDLFRVTATPEAGSRKIATTSRWLTNLGEKITVLHLDDLDGDGRLEVYAGTTSGTVRVLDLEGGKETGHCRTGAGRITALAARKGSLLAAGQGVWEIGGLRTGN